LVDLFQPNNFDCAHKKIISKRTRDQLSEGVTNVYSRLSSAEVLDPREANPVLQLGFVYIGL
jgi:hypothetical protein